MKFNKIVLVDKTGLRDWALSELQTYSVEEIVVHNDYPETSPEIIKRIGAADCVLVSWNTQITAKVLQACPNLRHVGMCCSLYDETSANVDIAYAKSHGIQVTGVRDYGDEGLIEFIIAELIRLVKGLGDHQWKADPVELTNRKLGIIGMGTTGQMLADRCQAFHMDLYYYNRSRKPAVEQKGIPYLPLPTLLSTCEIISTHLPKNSIVLGKDQFSQFGNGKVLINTSLGLTFDKNSFLKWIQQGDNFAILDGDGVGAHAQSFQNYSNIIVSDKVGGWTAEAIDRLSKKVIENIKQYLC